MVDFGFDFDFGGGGPDVGPPNPNDPHEPGKGKAGSWSDLLTDIDAAGERRKKGEGKGEPGKPQSFTGWVRSKPLRFRMYTARGFGEAASLIGAPTAQFLVDNTPLNQPYSALKNRFANEVVLPNLEWFDRTLGMLKSLDPEFEREERHRLSESEQAYRIADMILDQFGVKFLGSIVAQFATQDYFISKFNAEVSRKENLVAVVADRGVQLGTALVLNTGLSDQAVAAQKGLIKVFNNVGMDNENAEKWANYAVNFTLPNTVAYLASAELLTRMAKRAI